MAYDDLKIAILMNQMNRIVNHCSNEPFMGNILIPEIVGWTLLQFISQNLSAVLQHDHNITYGASLWLRRFMLD